MEREKIDFTDKELYYVALAFESHLNSRDTWISKGGARVINNAIKKITKNGLKRKNPKSILHPIYQFESSLFYFIPKIEQFVVGFEYELQDDNGDWLWNNSPQDKELLEKCIKDGRCRALANER